MDNRYYDNVVTQMKELLNENGFKSVEGGFANSDLRVSVEYSEEKQTYSLMLAKSNEDGSFAEPENVNSWLFDDSQTAKDAESVGIDFANSLKKALGIKHTRVTNAIDLPTVNKSGVMDISGFTKKMLDVFPTLKEEYKNHIAEYGCFLYLNFFGEKLVPLLTELFESGSKKQIKKLYDVLGDTYVKGDKETVNVMIAVLSAAGYQNEKSTFSIEEMLAENSHFLQGFKNFAAQFAASKKLQGALVKKQ